MRPTQLAATLHPNVKALLLRIVDGDPYTGEVGWEDAAMEAESAGLLTCTPPPGMSRPWSDIVAIVGPLTPLGREVAEACRPAPWREDGADIRGPDGVLEAECSRARLAERIVDLINADELAKAKRFMEE